MDSGVGRERESSGAVQSQNVASAYFTSKQMLHFDLAEPRIY